MQFAAFALAGSSAREDPEVIFKRVVEYATMPASSQGLPTSGMRLVSASQREQRSLMAST